MSNEHKRCFADCGGALSKVIMTNGTAKMFVDNIENDDIKTYELWECNQCGIAIWIRRKR